MKGKISEMFENEAIFDKFNLCSSPDGSTILTGNYNNTFHLLDVDPSAHTQYELNYKKTTVSKQVLLKYPISKLGNHQLITDTPNLM